MMGPGYSSCRSEWPLFSSLPIHLYGPTLWMACTDAARNFYQMRLDRRKNAELAKRNRERLSNPSSFPSVPTGEL
jgi:hypothetical protein